MNFFKNTRVKVKLIIGFLIVAFVIGIVGMVGIISLKNVGENAKKMYSKNLRSVYILTDTKDNLTEMKSDLSDLLNGKYEKDSPIKNKLEKNIEFNKKETDEYLTELEDFSMSDDVKKAYEEFTDKLKQYRILRENTLKLIDGITIWVQQKNIKIYQR